MQLSDKHVLIIDEAGMVDFPSMTYLLNEAKKAGSKVVLIGDPDQLKPIQKGEIFRGIAARTGYIELENIKRQLDTGDRQASMDLAKGEIDRAIQHYQSKQAITMAETSDKAAELLIADWKKDLDTTDLADTIMLSFTRKAVNSLNDRARETLIADNRIGNENISYQGLERSLHVSTGERLLFRENNQTLGVRNGDTATVKEVTTQQMRVHLDSGEELIIPKEYKALDYAYALTVHKSQGMTAKKVRVLIDSKYWDKNLSFVAMTRYKESLNIYADKENHPTEQALKQTLSRSTTKDNVIDWPLNFATRAGFDSDSDSLVGKVVNHVFALTHKVKNAYNFIVNYEADLLKEKQQNQQQELSQIRAKANLELRSELKEKIRKDKMVFKTPCEQLKKDFPEIGQLEILVKRRPNQTGYIAERADKQIKALSQQLLNDKSFSNVKGQHLDFYNQVKNIYIQQQEKSVSYEQ